MEQNPELEIKHVKNFILKQQQQKKQNKNLPKPI